MDSPFLYLAACSAKNRVLARLRRLRQPRYLVGAIVGVAYLYLVFFRRSGRGIRRATFGIPPGILAGLQTAGTFMLWAVVLARWILPIPTQPLKLSGAERDMLLTAPLARRRITRYKLLRSQVGVLFSTVLMLVVAWRSVNSAWSFLIGMFLLFTTVRLHLLAAALSRGAVLDGGGRRWDRETIAAVVVVAIGTAGAVWALVPGLVVLARTRDAMAALSLVNAGALRPPASIALLPFSLLIRPVFAATLGEFLAAVWPSLVLVFLNYAWVLRAQDRAEVSAAATEQETVEGRRQPARPVYRAAPFRLAPSGRPEWAIVWKNLILLGRYASAAMLARGALLLLVFASFFVASRRPHVAAIALPVAIAISCGLTLLGPYSFRNDLRQDLAQLSLLKTWPVTGERLLWGEVLGPVIVTASLAYLAVAVTGVLALALPVTRFPWSGRLALGSSALVLFPPLILAQVVVQNAIVILFPGWVAIGPSRPRGVEAMGQQLLMFAGSMLLVLGGIVPGAIVGGAVGFVGYRLIGWAAVLPASALVAALLVVEAAIAIHVLGAVLDRTDPTAVGPG